MFRFSKYFSEKLKSFNKMRCSVACSTAIALEWDAAFKGMNDPSGRAVKGVHEQAY
jgi:asparagine synthase (glutamine-hydrolysing)